METAIETVALEGMAERTRLANGGKTAGSEKIQEFTVEVLDGEKVDYNPPSVIMYSIGNEVAEPFEERGVRAGQEKSVSKFRVAICTVKHRLLWRNNKLNERICWKCCQTILC